MRAGGPYCVMARSALGESGERRLLIHLAAIHPGLQHGNVGNPLGVMLQVDGARVARQHNKVGTLAGFQAADMLVDVALPGGVQGFGPQRSGFLSAFFTLVGTHGLHVTFGLVWLVVLMVQIARHGLIHENQRRLMCLSMFWHFLDVVWIGVFTFVYLMGVL